MGTGEDADVGGVNAQKDKADLSHRTMQKRWKSRREEEIQNRIRTIKNNNNNNNNKKDEKRKPDAKSPDSWTRLRIIQSKVRRKTEEMQAKISAGELERMLILMLMMR